LLKCISEIFQTQNLFLYFKCSAWGRKTTFKDSIDHQPLRLQLLSHQL